MLKGVGLGCCCNSPRTREIEAEDVGVAGEGGEKGIGRRGEGGFELSDVDDNGHLGKGIAGIEGWVTMKGK